MNSHQFPKLNYGSGAKPADHNIIHGLKNPTRTGIYSRQAASVTGAYKREEIYMDRIL